MVEKKCIYCNKTMIVDNPRKKFCSANCRNNYYYNNNVTIKRGKNKGRGYKDRARESARNYYNKHKNNPEFKRKNYERTKKWIAENRERFNELMRKHWKTRRAKLFARPQRTALLLFGSF